MTGWVNEFFCPFFLDSRTDEGEPQCSVGEGGIGKSVGV